MKQVVEVAMLRENVKTAACLCQCRTELTTLNQLSVAHEIMVYGYTPTAQLSL